MTERLRRPLWARCFGTVLQTVLSVFAFSTIALLALTIYAAAAGKSGAALSWFLVPDVLLTLLWARGFTCTPATSPTSTIPGRRCVR